jgi:hypothetical protein
MAARLQHLDAASPDTIVVVDDEDRNTGDITHCGSGMVSFSLVERPLMTERTSHPWGRVLVFSAVLLAGGCIFERAAPSSASPVPISRGVSVTVEYVQPGLCLNSTNRCADPVVFFGSWMRPGQEVTLTAVPGTFTWTGRAASVPVNFPPDQDPYLVRVFDPYLLDTSSGGVTAARLRVGGQVLVDVDAAGTPSESGLVYIDDNGVGHNPL